MSMPMELEEDGRGRSAQYDAIAVEYSQSNGLNASLPLNNRAVPETFWMKFQRNMDDHRTRFCSCCDGIPTFLLFVVVMILFGLAITAVVSAIVFASSGSSAELKSDEKTLDISRSFPEWPSRLDEENVANSIRAKSMMPFNVSDCAGFGFACTSNPSEVIATTLRCNGVRDCMDGSDEVNCIECQTAYSCVADPHNKLSKNRHCLTANELCDGVNHCPDGWDEKAMCRSECSPTEFRCKGGDKCLPGTAMCDGKKDCPKGDDEIQCKTCNGGAKFCSVSQTCIPEEQLCNGNWDCEDGSDEQSCNCRSCSGNGKMLCADGTCLNASRICDGVIDCSGGMDEQNCPGSCPLDQEQVVNDTIRCSDGLLYSANEACIGKYKQCSSSCRTCNKKEAFSCGNKNCIPKSKVCDGFKDCDGGEDEKDCPSCPVMLGHFQCPNATKCVHMDRRCDGVWDCADGSDEIFCDDKCPEDSFICPTDKQCLPMSARCDGVVDCRDHADEINCTCQECRAHLSATYMCEGSGICMARSKVCAPYSTCPQASKADRYFCSQKVTLAMNKAN